MWCFTWAISGIICNWEGNNWWVSASMSLWLGNEFQFMSQPKICFPFSNNIHDRFFPKIKHRSPNFLSGAIVFHFKPFYYHFCNQICQYKCSTVANPLAHGSCGCRLFVWTNHKLMTQIFLDFESLLLKREFSFLNHYRSFSHAGNTTVVVF